MNIFFKKSGRQVYKKREAHPNNKTLWRNYTNTHVKENTLHFGNKAENKKEK